MMTASVDLSGFNAGMAGLVQALGVESVVVVKKEVGELMKRLVKMTPAADAKNISATISTKFANIGNDRNSDTSWLNGKGGQSATGIKWISVSSKYLVGVVPVNDMRNATLEEVKAVSYKITKSGSRLKASIQGHGRQKALIYQTILTKASTIKKLIAAKIKNRGRLKAGWLAAYFSHAVDITGSNLPPSFVTRHKDGIGGYYIDGLQVPGNPSFSIANRAAGIGNAKNKMDWIVQAALDGRAKDMATNMRLFISGKKHLSDYAK